jgi:DNA-binding transcriptional ArsR family regulator
MMRSPAEPERLDDTLLALADPTRREILRRLSRGDRRVTDVAAPFAISLNSVSKHIVTLERAGLVRRRREGREHILSLDPAPIERAARWLASQQALWMARLDALDEVLRSTEPPRIDNRPAHSRLAAKSKRTK